MSNDVAHKQWWQIFEVVFGIPFLAAILLQFAVPLFAGGAITSKERESVATRGQAEAARLAIKRVRADLPAAISEVDDTPATDAAPTARSAAATWRQPFPGTQPPLAA